MYPGLCDNAGACLLSLWEITTPMESPPPPFWSSCSAILACVQRPSFQNAFTDGYGISESLIQGITNSLIITIDNGVSAIEPIRAAKAAGNTVIVLDHHLPQDTLPEADLIVDPPYLPRKKWVRTLLRRGTGL